MKKLLSLVLVLAVVLSSMSFAFAAGPSDTAGNKYESSILKLMSLGIVNGYTDGTYKPTNNVTRAEFAKLMCVALGYGEAANAAKNTVVFSDVPASHWAAGYVAVAFRNEIIKGVGNGKFDPEADVTYEQVVTIIMRSLGKGYDKMADTMGGYPVGYLSIASQKEITKDSDGQPGVAANRSLVAKLIDNALDKPWMNMDASKITSDGKVEYNFTVGTDTILNKGLHLKKYTAVVDSTDVATSKVTFKSDVDGKKVYTAAAPTKVVGLKNCSVEVWEKDGVIYSLDNKTTVKFDKLEKINGTDKTTDAAVNAVAQTGLSKIELKNDGGVFYPTLNTAGTQADVTWENNFSSSASTIDNFIGKMAKIYINSDNKVYRVEAFSNLATPAIAAEVTATRIKYQKYDANDVYLSNIDNATDELYVFIDGKVAAYSDLKADMYFESYVNSDGKKIIIAASTGKAQGKLTSYQKDKVTIAGTTLDITADNYVDTLKYASINNGTKYEKYNTTDLKDKDVVAYKNLIGKVAFVKGTSTTSTTDFFGMVKSFASEGKTVTLIRDVDGVSTEVTYSVKSDSDDLNGTTTGDGRITWTTFKSNLTNAPIGVNSGDEITVDTAASSVGAARIYKFYLNSDNKVTRVNALTGWTTVGANANNKFDKDNDFIMKGSSTTKYYVDGTVFFDLKKNKVRYWKDFEGNTATAATMDLLPKSNAVNADVVAFTGNTFENQVKSTDYFYAYVSGEEMAGDYYLIATPALTGDSRLKLHKDDANANTQQMDKKFIQYYKDGDKVKVRSVATAAYDITGTKGVFATDALSQATIAYGTFVDKDGNDVKVNAGPGSLQIDGTAATAGTNYWYKMDTAVTVVRMTHKSATDGAIDSAVVSDITSIPVGSKMTLIILDNKVRGIYFEQ